ncbi:uncharacterized protein PFL1_02071 [Pseudozyma flocculosa PF-1]|uniref:Phosphogluconate dehydrogenase NAD-binding putative C-terminal domain-containing protein n=1 Tax=Pseudozyma flocculosa TaxID=84751 RepID=A0A5C3F1N7_9BASI|nr:uncharacterized protein PFL1_02071 [Pseudozyma flocculosa PF-1]EPQ30546.1 hypothetical protein PFL1_02071 [Pseudozyma flocculosa PF-1]SPO37637.1 uncharacterized protein PSFLO_03112 [Pseudozyma flocculosa]
MIPKTSSTTSKTILLNSCGAMGAPLGALLVHAGHRVLTPAAGRSRATLDRASQYGIIAVPKTLPELLVSQQADEIDIFLSVLAPSDALPLAKQVASAMAARTTAGSLSKRRTYIDLNAVSPSTASEIDAALTGNNERGAADFTYLDGSIIGATPRWTTHTRETLSFCPTIYLSHSASSSAHHPEAIDELTQLLASAQWKVRSVHDARVGSAKALKLCYTAIAKGLMGLASTAFLTASSFSPSTARALATELMESQRGSMDFLNANWRHVVPKSARFVGEMQEVRTLMSQQSAATDGSGAGFAEMADLFSAFAEVYRSIDEAEKRAKASRQAGQEATLVSERMLEFERLARHG